MLEGIPSELLVQGGAVAILAVTVLGIIRGWLVPASSLEKMLTLHAERLQEAHERADEWKGVAKVAITAAAEKDHQLSQLLEVGRTQVALLEGMRKSAAAGGGDR